MDRPKIKKLSRWFKSQKKERQCFRRVHVVPQMSAVPTDIDHDIYIVEKEHKKIWAVFNCPCEQGHRVVANLSPRRRPYWGIAIRRDMANFWPSFWLKGQCKSHFWVRQNCVYWASSDDDYDWITD